MSIVDSLTNEQLQEVQSVMNMKSDATGVKGKKIKEVAEKLNINERTMYKIRNSVEDKLNGFVPQQSTITGTSTLLDADGEIKLQWVKEKSNDSTDAAIEAIEELLADAKTTHKPTPEPKTSIDELLAVYISNDVHLGALSWHEETRDRDWDLGIAESKFKQAIDSLIERTPPTKECIVVDLGDLMEIDDMKNMTPNSGNVLDTDGRYPKVLKVAMECMKYFVTQALNNHSKVRFINIAGNHDQTVGYAVTAFIDSWFRNDPRVIVDDKAAFQKYYKFGKTLLGFAHGDGLKMKDAGEVMAMHNEDIWSETTDRFYHFGHNHKDAVVDGRLCKAESHRNIAPLNAWAAHKGFGRNAGTIKAIIYDKYDGEDTRITYKVKRN